MHVEVLLVANAAAVVDGLLHVQGGGWEHYSAPVLPWTLRGAIAGVVTFDDTELGSTPELSIAIRDDGGHVAGFTGSIVVNAMRPATSAPGVPVRVPFDVPFSTVVRAPTIVNVTVTGAAEDVTITFAVRDPIPDAPA